MQHRESDWTLVYSDVDPALQRLIWYVRLTPIETERFRHGLALATTFPTRESAEAFADLVDEFMDEAVIMHNQRAYDPPRDY
ncbi:hypothetical protein CcrC1_gp060c [Caulobacter phage C1]|nr:hypothetical protein CcrC1_gp060c [Caulobacter phage C1]UTU08287.1 hypothetical protein CcrC2_gp059c [Caulobacter phage C2]UTU08810.1 hypothetical protein CcrJ4_gp059c [Caulobacter phage J4]UTU09362.1 hypothetical protein CcrBL47_gp076c [Caulobacter phage BL47]UTU09922.1 hypothetical protein CcrRB23_gp060c [Caulobacter phage RB23]WGN96947.1 hypothetical protein [Bertelyvirus sp.]